MNDFRFWRLAFFVMLVFWIISTFLFIQITGGLGVAIPKEYTNKVPSEYYRDLNNLVKLLPSITNSINKNDFIATLDSLNIQSHPQEYVNLSDTSDKSTMIILGDMKFEFDRHNKLSNIGHLYLNDEKKSNLKELNKSYSISFVVGHFKDGNNLFDAGPAILGPLLLVLFFLFGFILYLLGEFKFKKLKTFNFSITVFILIAFVCFILLLSHFYTQQKLLTNNMLTLYPDFNIPLIVAGLHRWFIIPSILFDLFFINLMVLVLVMWRKHQFNKAV